MYCIVGMSSQICRCWGSLGGGGANGIQRESLSRDNGNVMAQGIVGMGIRFSCLEHHLLIKQLFIESAEALSSWL